jgi:hypothetical protein
MEESDSQTLVGLLSVQPDSRAPALGQDSVAFLSICRQGLPRRSAPARPT